jgi:hypothetical protein
VNRQASIVNGSFTIKHTLQDKALSSDCTEGFLLKRILWVDASL